ASVLDIAKLVSNCGDQYNPLGILLRVKQEAEEEFGSNFSEAEALGALLDVVKINKHKPLTGQALWQAIQKQFPLPQLTCAIDTFQVCQAVIAELKTRGSVQLKIV
ncbi:MAG: hypothetical protein Q8Q23_01520, partial [bacterium]|nr:hypothetical protein [bacterium]